MSEAHKHIHTELGAEGTPFDYRRIPGHMMSALQRYIDKGEELGHFLTAVVENDLRRAVERADLVNRPLLPTYVCYLYNRAPAACWGSPEAVKRWRDMGGSAGVYRTLLADPGSFT